jgi:hypothetical protein
MLLPEHRKGHLLLTRLAGRTKRARSAGVDRRVTPRSTGPHSLAMSAPEWAPDAASDVGEGTSAARSASAEAGRGRRSTGAGCGATRGAGVPSRGDVCGEWAGDAASGAPEGTSGAHSASGPAGRWRISGAGAGRCARPWGVRRHEPPRLTARAPARDRTTPARREGNSRLWTTRAAQPRVALSPARRRVSISRLRETMRAQPTGGNSARPGRAEHGSRPLREPAGDRGHEPGTGREPAGRGEVLGRGPRFRRIRARGRIRAPRVAASAG